MTLVGVYVALSKSLTAVIPVFLLAFLRFAIAAVAMVPWVGAAPGEARLSAAEKRQLFFQSFFGNFLFSICMLTGVSMTTATAAGLIMSTLPAVVAVLSRLLLGERMGARAGWAIGLAVGGIALLQLARGGSHGGASGWLGDALVFGSVWCEAAYVVIGKQLAASRSPMRISALINLWGLVLTTPLGLAQLATFGIAALGARDWAMLVFYSLSASVFAVWLWMKGLRRVPASQAGVFTVALPLAATGIGVAFLGESFTLVHGLALACAIGAVVTIASQPAARAPAAPRAGSGASSGSLN
jgi:drug/metabolite transporter (DMT)-like permease